MKINRISSLLSIMAAAALLISPASTKAQDDAPAPEPAAMDGLPEDVAAIVNGEEITAEAFRNFYAAYVAQTYFHFIDEARRDEIAQEALDLLVSDAILVQETLRRGVKGDLEETQNRMEAFEKRYARDEETRKAFEENREKLKEEILADTRVEALRASVMAGPSPTEEEIRAYYVEQSALFTTPRALDLSIILLAVPPHGAVEEWKAAEAKAGELHAQLLAGDDFAALAKQHSGHDSASEGGALGLMHDGQLIDEVAAALSELKTGAFTEPMRILEGVAIFKINDRKPAELRSFDDVRGRAAALLERETANNRWSAFLDGLRARARIKKASSPVRFLRDS
ncbi:MAG: peptidylprolyl isomerase [Parvularculaceae bacterium]